MKKILLPLLLIASGSAFASLNDGIQAYHRGDYAVAIKNFEAALDTDPAAKHYLASLYIQGKGVGKDETKAKALYTEAAQSGYLPSITNLGTLYLEAKDYVKARKYLALGAEQNDARSQHLLGQIYQRALGTDRDFEKAASLYKQAAEANYKPAQDAYGMLLAQGQGVKLDFIEAYAWINLAAETGNTTAIANLKRLSHVLKGEKKDTARKRAEELKAQFAQ